VENNASGSAPPPPDDKAESRTIPKMPVAT